MNGASELALALVELSSVARGVVVADAMVKRAEVEVLRAAPVSPGKFLVLVCGGVAEVEESFAVGVEIAAERLVDRLFLPGAHPRLVPAIAGARANLAIDSVGLVECFTVAATVRAADVACKETPVHLLELRLGQGLGGKGYVVFTGPLEEVQASLDAACQAVPAEALCASEILPAPHDYLTARGMIWER